MPHLSALMGAGAIAAGVSAALIAGADVASADTGSGSDASKSSSSSSDKAARPSARQSDSSAAGSTGGARADQASKADKRARAARVTQRENATPTAVSAVKTQVSSPAAVDDAAEVHPTAAVVAASAPIASTNPAPIAGTADEGQPAAPAARVTPKLAAALTARATQPEVKTAQLTATAAAAADAPQLPVLPGPIQSVIFDIIGVAVTFVAGPPVTPPGSTVTVRTSTLELAQGHTVPADWYYPAGDEPPQRMILLQHGFLGVGAMYSYTASYLAESTNSIVVVPTLSSNRYARDGFWLGDDQVYRATANLFLGDRNALTTSALAAGYAQRYGADVPLPETFALIGHSLGGGVVSGAAGYYADAITASGGVNHLAGVVLLDAAPPGDVLPDALDKLDGLGTYVPVIELGAPKETISKVDVALNEHRPGIFNGVILKDGKHLDSMQGGTPLISLISHLYQGFPTAQNQAAAQTLIAGWTNDIFAGRIDPATGACAGAGCAGIYGNLGQTIPLTTKDGPTSATVIGAAALTPGTTFQPASATALVAAGARRVLLDV
ncbi:MAG: hypothetical protein ABWY93_12830 [Mycobacterium sp.]